jgi:hypothetical protein
MDFSDTWIFDIDYTNYISCDREAFVEYYPYSNIYANDSKFKNIGGTILQSQKKTVIVQILVYKKRINVFLSNTIYYLDIRANLISIF